MITLVKNKSWFDSVPRQVQTLFTKEAKQPKLIITLLFFILALLGCTWIPFYPWWMAGIVAFVVAVVSYGFPYLSLVLLSGFVIGAAGYQTAEFGLFMMLFMMVVLLVSLFEWKLGFLVFMAVFLSRFGLSLMVPVLSATMLPLLLSLSVLVVSGVFLTFLVTCGNMTIGGMFIGPVHETSFMVFIKSGIFWFVPSDLGQALGNIQNADMELMSTVVTDNLGLSVIPIMEIILWGFVVFLVFWFFNRSRKTVGNPLLTSFIPAGLATGTFFVSLYMLLTPTTESLIAGALIFPMVVSTILLGRGANEYFFTYFVNLELEKGVGTRISQMDKLGDSSFELIGGLDDVKDDIKESILIPLLRSDISAKYGVEAPHGILLFGPPGCGKTLLMKALANELKVEMITVKCSDIMSKWYGESESKLAEMFEIAKERRPSIIFFDDLEAMAKHRDMYAGDDVTPRLLSILLSELDGMDNAAGIILVGTTNKPELIDPALLRPGRFDKVIYVPPPDLRERGEILKVHLRNRPVEDGIDLDAISLRSERFSGADLANVAKEAAVLAMKRSIESEEAAVITHADLLKVTATVKPSITLSMLRDYEILKMDYERKMHHVTRDDRKLAVRWDEVIGVDSIKKEIEGYIEILVKEPEVLEDFKLKTGRGVLLFGPPGCGKSNIMRGAANELKIPIQVISSTEFVGTYSSGSVPVKELFFRARENTPAIILIEDIDIIGSREAIDTPETSKVMIQILSEIDNVEAKEHVLVVATTNDPQALHPVLLRPGRFDKMFYVPPPDAAARELMFKTYLKNIPMAPDVDEGLLHHLAADTEGYSSADIAAVVDEAKFLVVVKDGDSNGETQRVVSKDHLFKALSTVESSIGEEYVLSSESFMKAYKVRK